MKPVALLSVYNKEGIVDFAKELATMGWELIASGGTKKVLEDAELVTRDVADLVGGGAILGHRVVTLSREIHAGLLATESEEDKQELESLGIPRIDLVCVDLYPLKEEIAKPEANRESVIEKTDIGGPTMLRSAAKGRRIVVCNPKDRQMVIDWLKAGRPNEKVVIDALAAYAEVVVGDYCLASARYHGAGKYDGMIGERVLECKYGENAWQAPAGLYRNMSGGENPLSLSRFEVVAGTAPSYNNLVDVERLRQTMTHIAAVWGVNRGWVPKIAIAVKHGNPCGAAISDETCDRMDVIRKMVSGDTRAIFGGLVMTNFGIDALFAEEIHSFNLRPGEKRRILDGIIAPSFSPEAIELLKRKEDKCRFLVNPKLREIDSRSLDANPRFRYVCGDILIQPNYTYVLQLADPELQKFGQATVEDHNDMMLAWAIGSTSNSNTITLVKERMLIGNGVGQQDRVGCCELAIKRATDAGHSVGGAVAYSDSFFPFPDGPEVLAKAGVKAILASSGSRRDDEIIKFCQEHGVVLYLIPDAKGRGFFGH